MPECGLLLPMRQERASRSSKSLLFLESWAWNCHKAKELPRDIEAGPADLDCLCFQHLMGSQTQAPPPPSSGSGPCLPPPRPPPPHQLQGCSRGLWLTVSLRAWGVSKWRRRLGLACRVERLASELRLINPRNNRSKQASGRFQEPGPRPQN